ncbi:MAG TPA: homoserine kinase [Actinomycetes bacterium]|nr:homoserine kinase [Actinomycetes bacterium]
MGQTAAVRVRVPASSANLGPGFDTLGLALTLYDEVEVALVPGSGPLDVEVVGECADTVPRNASHLVARAVATACEGQLPAGLRLRCVNRLPHGRGLGSSAAAIIAGIIAGQELVGCGRDNDTALQLAATMEGHPDNVAAALLGGATIAWTDAQAQAHAVRIDVHPEVRAVALVPPVPVATRTARALLPAQVSHGDAAANAARAALLVEALGHRPDLLLEATTDRLHQVYRTPAMPESVALMDSLRGRGVAAVVSGAGPTVLALTDPDGVDAVVAAAPAGWRAFALEVDRVGATVVSG